MSPLFSLTEVTETTDDIEHDRTLYGFEVHGRATPLVKFAYGSREEAETARTLILHGVVAAKIVLPLRMR
jgi:hypothetical protein